MSASEIGDEKRGSLSHASVVLVDLLQLSHETVRDLTDLEVVILEKLLKKVTYHYKSVVCHACNFMSWMVDLRRLVSCVNS